MVSMPNRDYWLETDERREEFVRRTNTMLFGVAFFTNLMWSAIYHSIIQSSIETRLHLGMWAVWATVGVMMVFTFVYLFIAFRKPKDSATATEEE